jgi:ParB family protein of integrating conjugative element (PFGI_1 class)
MANKPTLVPSGGRAPVSVSDVRARLNAGQAGPGPQGLLPSTPITQAQINRDEEYDRAPMVLHPRQIKAYDRNPRTKPNPAYDEIFSSIEADGLTSQVSVTRRQGSTDFMIYGGGNTRLEIMQILADRHPNDPRFNRMNVTYRVWRGESWPLIAHLAENETRGDMSFWDRACGIANARKDFQIEAGVNELSLNELRARCKSCGLLVSRATLQIYQFATETLLPIGPWLTYTHAETLRARVKSANDVLIKLDPTAGLAARFAGELQKTLELTAASLVGSEEATKGMGSAVELDSGLLVGAIDDIVAGLADISSHEARQMYVFLANNPGASASALRAEARKGHQPKRDAAAPSLTAPAPPTQALLPTPMLAAIPATAGPYEASAPALDPSPHDDADEISSAVAAQPGAVPRDHRVEKPRPALSLADEAMRTAQRLLVGELCVVAANLPAGFFMDLPEGSALIDGDAKRNLVARAGWSFLAMLSGQLDHRIALMVPASSRWARCVQDGSIAARLAVAGIAVDDAGALTLDAAAIFFALSEEQVVGPAVIDLMRAAHAAFKVNPSILPRVLVPLTRGVTA